MDTTTLNQSRTGSNDMKPNTQMEFRVILKILLCGDGGGGSHTPARDTISIFCIYVVPLNILRLVGCLGFMAYQPLYVI